MSLVKEHLEQRVSDLKNPGTDREKQGSLIEATAALMVYRDLVQSAKIAREVAMTAAVERFVEPTVEDVMAIAQMYQNYLGPAYQVLVTRGDVPSPSVQTTPSPAVRGKEDLVS